MKKLPTKPNAYKAVDGNGDSNFKGSSCTLTQPEAQPWWVVDLGDVYQISTVTITNRGDCCGELFHRSIILVGGVFNRPNLLNSN